MVSQCLFNFRFKYGADELKEIEEQIDLPLADELDSEEFGFRLIDKHKIPCGEQEQFLEAIKKFVVLESERSANEEFNRSQVEFHRNFALNKSRVLLELNRLASMVNDEQQPIDRRKKSLIQPQNSLDGGLGNFGSNYVKQPNNFENQHNLIGNCEANGFRLKYHELIHSGFLTDSLVKLEHSFALTLSNLVICKENAIKELTDKQANEMEEKIKLIGKTVNEADINLLAHQHYQATDELRKQWSTKIRNCKEMQKKDFLDWIDQVYDDFKVGHKEKILNSIKCLTDSTNQNLLNRMDSSSESIESTKNAKEHLNIVVVEPKLEESFTINLGSQLKSSHNLRLTAMDILDLCRINFNDVLASQPNPHRIHTAMSLYSNSSALVLIADNRISSYGSLKSQFSRLCNLSTEFHFSELEQQLDEIRQEARYLIKQNGKTSTTNELLLEPGDFYITKHSNLAKVHSVYHLVADETVLSPEINSRHPVILGLRNILKISYLNDINTIFIPLLLINELNESITLQWCIKRAELVLKCVKGFMIEISALTPSNEENNNKTIQFLVPTVS